MTKQKSIRDMHLGELIETFFTLKSRYLSKLVDENHPRPETWDKYGGIIRYNAGITEEYKKERGRLIVELNRRERLYK